MKAGPPALAAVLLILLTGALAWQRAAAPSDGGVAQLSNAPWRGSEITVHLVLPGSPLRGGDVLVAVDGRPLSEIAGYLEPRLGDTHVYTVRRDGRLIDVPVRAGTYAVGAAVRGNAAGLLFVLSLLAVGAYVFAHRPRDPAARALLVCSSLVCCGAVAWLLGADPLTLATAGPTVAQVLGEAALAMVWGAALHFALILPGSAFHPGRRAVAGLYALPLVLHAGYLAVALPAADGPTEQAGRLAQISLVPSTTLPPVCVLLTVLSYRSMRDANARRRARWVLVPFCAAVGAFLGVWTVPSVLGLPVPPENLIPVLFLPWSLMLGAVVLRYRWFDIELIVRRSLLYGALTLCVLAVFVATTWLLSAVLGPADDGLGTLLASMLVAVIAQPLLGRLRRRISRLVHGDRADPYEALDRLGRIDAAAHPQRVLREIAEALAQTLRLRYVEIDLGAVRASCGISLGGAEPHALMHGTETLGRLLLEAGAGREPFGPADEQLLATLLRQVGHAASALRLGARLQASREQLVLAREDERRRLHHGLHDGLGSALAANIMHLEVARVQLRTDPAAARATLDRLIGEVDRLRTGVREIIDDQRPAELDRYGLTGAVRHRIGDRIALRVVEEGDLTGLPAAVEVAAFNIVVEAVHNAVRHSGATACVARLTRSADLVIEVTDDGRGLPVPHHPGSGFLSMRERAEELGGRWSAGPGPGGGVRIRAVLPLDRSQADLGPVPGHRPLLLTAPARDAEADPGRQRW